MRSLKVAFSLSLLLSSGSYRVGCSSLPERRRSDDFKEVTEKRDACLHRKKSRQKRIVILGVFALFCTSIYFFVGNRDRSLSASLVPRGVVPFKKRKKVVGQGFPVLRVSAYSANKLPLLWKEEDGKLVDYRMSMQRWKEMLSSEAWEASRNFGKNKALLGGYDGLAEQHFRQLEVFRGYAAQGAWEQFGGGGNHYDWWVALGCYDKSRYGTDYAVYMDDIAFLKKYKYDGVNDRYQGWSVGLAHRETIALFLRATGWCDQNDHVTGEVRYVPTEDRIGKFLHSAFLFEHKDLYEKLNGLTCAILRRKGENYYREWVKKYMTKLGG